MGGYAPYVWGSYGLVAAVLIWNVLAPRWRRRQLERDFERRRRLEARVQQVTGLRLVAAQMLGPTELQLVAALIQAVVSMV